MLTGIKAGMLTGMLWGDADRDKGRDADRDTGKDAKATFSSSAHLIPAQYLDFRDTGAASGARASE